MRLIKRTNMPKSTDNFCQRLFQLAQEFGIEVLNVQIDVYTEEEMDENFCQIAYTEKRTILKASLCDIYGTISPMTLECEKRNTKRIHLKKQGWNYRLVLPSKKIYGTFEDPNTVFKEFNRLIFI